MSFVGDNFDDDLDAELRSLFDDDRLDLRPRADAGTSIIAGARRVRRRRAALTGGGVSAAVIALVSGAVLLNNPPPQQAASPAAADASLAMDPPSLPVPPASAPMSALPPAPLPEERDEPRVDTTPAASGAAATVVPPPPRATSMQALAVPILGPDGYGELKLGMSFSDAVATGSLLAKENSRPPEDGCGTYQLTEGDMGVREVVVSSERGIVTFSASGARTPEGIGAGSSAGEVEQAYPEVARGSATYSAPTGSGGNYVFYVDDDQVDSVQLIGPVVAC